MGFVISRKRKMEKNTETPLTGDVAMTGTRIVWCTVTPNDTMGGVAYCRKEKLTPCFYIIPIFTFLPKTSAAFAKTDNRVSAG